MENRRSTVRIYHWLLKVAAAGADREAVVAVNEGAPNAAALTMELESSLTNRGLPDFMVTGITDLRHPTVNRHFRIKF